MQTFALTVNATRQLDGLPIAGVTQYQYNLGCSLVRINGLF
jgi:hypothetical protein